MSANVKKSFFKEYFLYKLRSSSGIFIASMVINFVGFSFISTVLIVYANLSEKAAGKADPYGEWLFGVMIIMYFAFCVMIASFIALLVITVITPPITFKTCTRTDYTDTLGSLPITYSQRFWGDFTAGLLVNIVPVMIFGTYSVIASEIAKTKFLSLNNDAYSYAAGISDFFRVIVLTVIAAYISGYAISAFITQCCGKTGAGVLFSALTMAAIPGIVLCGSGIIAENTVGVIPMMFMTDSVKAIMPLGAAAHFFEVTEVSGSYWDFGGYHFAVQDPVSVVIILAAIAVFTAGAYFVGKIRKMERTGRDFAFETAYNVISAATALLVLGLFLLTMSINSSNSSVQTLIISFVVTLVLFLALELMHKKSLKKFYVSILKCAAVWAVGFGFYVLSGVTNGFGIGGNVPDAGDVGKVIVSGDYFFSTDGDPIEFNDAESVRTIVEGHKKLLDDHKSEITTGASIELEYRLKNGLSVKRGYSGAYYSENSFDALRDLAKEINRLPQSGENCSAFLKYPDYPGLRIMCSITEKIPNITETSEAWDNYSTYSYIIKPEKIAEFKRIFTEEMSEYYDRYPTYDKDISCVVQAYYTENGREMNEGYSFGSEYKNTIAFIKNPENVIERAEDLFGKYSFTLVMNKSHTESITLYISSASAGKYGSELMKLVEPRGETEEYSEIFDIKADNLICGIKSSDEEQAVELFFKAIGESTDSLSEVVL